MQVVILCGGRGTRAYPLTETIPKPMVPIGGEPLLVHLMRLFAQQGHRDFVLSVGHKQDVIRDYFAHAGFDWRVEIVDTGEDSDTGDRIRGCADLLEDVFVATYGDGLANLSMADLLAFHGRHPGLVTITSVPLPCQYGLVGMDPSGRVSSFREKPTLAEHWINAGFMVMEREALTHWSGTNLEREVLPSLSRMGLVYAFRHEGFFKSLDSFKDQQEFEALIRSGEAPWSMPHSPSP